MVRRYGRILWRVAAGLVAVAAGLCPAGLSAQAETQVEAARIADNIYRLRCSAGVTSNCLLFTGAGGALLVDTGFQQTAGTLASVVDSLGAGAVRYVLNTHAHADHTGANARFGAHATVIAHESFAASYRTGYGLLAEMPDHALPDKTFLKTYSLEFGGEKIEITHFPRCHSEADAIVSFERSGVVCTGDLIAPHEFPWLDPEAGGDVREYTKTIFKIKRMFPETTIFVPGHGPNLTRKDVEEYHAMMAATTAVIQSELDAGRDTETMIAEEVLAEWESWSGPYVSTEDWIRTVAASLKGDVPERKKPVFEPLYYTARRSGATAAIAQYHELRKTHPDDYDFGERNLNALGYYFLDRERYDEAIEVFELNVELFPETANPYDSLGEAYMARGDTELAIEAYSKALAINPDMPSAIQALEKLNSR
jgi:glyoxylase-like metal-dependent hydrolase (beta-lactamase superfamily II)